MIKQVDERISRVLSRFRWPFRGILTSLNTATDLSLAQVAGAAGEVLQSVQLFQQYGFASAPPDGSQVVVIPLGGKTDQAVLVACDNGALTVKGLQSGESVLYGLEGDRVYMSASGIVFESTRQVTVSAPDLVVNGISVVNHVHNDVQTGSDNSGKPVA